MIKKVAFCFIFILLGVLKLTPNGIYLSDNSTISLLTNSPWDAEVYSVYGHTAIRVCDQENGLDYAFNYGLFDFDSPNFLWRFVKGETDYMVGAIPYNDYIREYQLRGVTTFEQVLNLSLKEKQSIWNALFINVQPENREYRYNFLYDNCSTRPRDIIENNIQGEIKYTSNNKLQTFRDLLHECVHPYPWMRFGIDLIIGNEADKQISDREKMFLPLYLKNAYTGAQIVSQTGVVRDLVLIENVVTQSFDDGKVASERIDLPLISGLILLVLVCFISFFNLKGKMIFMSKILDVLLFTIYGLIGCVIAFLVFVSEHPATSPNWNLVWLNPIMLIIVPLFFVKYLSKAIYYYHFINFAILSLFLLFWIFIPQYLEIAFVPFILSIWLRSGVGSLQNKLKKYING